MASKLKVAVAGATGETGQSIMDALLAKPEQYEVYALSRPASANKPVLVAYAGRGAIIKSVDFGSNDALVAALTGIHVVISCLLVLQDKEQNAIVEASIQAKVQRYVPGFFGPACPARGVMKVRELKENLLDHVKRLYLPYTVIDFGWWYQLGLPPLPSGRVQSKFEYALPEIMGDGEVPFALIDKRDIGEYVARVIVDPRTLNKMVFGYGEVWKQNDIFDALEEISGEKIVRQRLTEKDMKNIVSSVYQMMASQTNVTDYTTMVEKNLEIMTKAGLTEYKYSMGIRGDNTPEHAKYLGYLDAKELYPDMETIGLKAFMREMLEGKIRAVYSAA